jgi:hypothetical protein
VKACNHAEDVKKVRVLYAIVVMKESMGHLILSERHVKEKNKYEQV